MQVLQCKWLGLIFVGGEYCADAMAAYFHSILAGQRRQVQLLDIPWLRF